jgi:hypothetical protein
VNSALRNVLTLTVLASSCFVARVAHADAEPSAAERATAEALFRDAKELEAKGALDLACPKFVESNRLDPKPGALLNAAACHEAAGLTASAWEEYREAIQMAAKYNQQERRDFAEKKMKEIEPKLSRLVVTMNAPPRDLAIDVDGRRLSGAVLDTPFPVDPGPHVVRASASGRAEFSQKLDVGAEAGVLIVSVPELASDSGRPASQTAASKRDKRDIVPPTPSIVLFTLAIGAASVGAAYGLSAIDWKNIVDKNCQGRVCNAEGADASDSAHRDAAISTVGFAMFGVLAAAGGGYWLWTSKSHTSGATIVPQMTAHGCGISIGGPL